MSIKSLYHYYMGRLYWSTKHLRVWIRKKINRPYVKTWTVRGANQLFEEGDMVTWTISGTKMIVTKIDGKEHSVTLTYAAFDPDAYPVAPHDMMIVTGKAYPEA